MNETENKKQSENPSSPSVSKWATISFWCAIIGWGCFAAGIPLVFTLNHLDDIGLAKSMPWLESLGRLLLAILAIGWLVMNLFAFISGLIGLWDIRKHKGLLTGTSNSLSGIVFALLVIVPIFLFFLYLGRMFTRILCGENMYGLRIAIMMYADDSNQQYPAPDKWCDLLVKHGDVSPKQFRCVGVRSKGDPIYSNYAINPNCDINCPNDVVLLFETKAGWNQHGGPELLTFDNHPDKGVNVLFNNGDVKFIKPEEVGKLKWKANEPNRVQMR